MGAKIKTKAEECGAKDGASAGDVETIIKRPASHEGKCVIACLHEINGVMMNNEWVRMKT